MNLKAAAKDTCRRGLLAIAACLMTMGFATLPGTAEAALILKFEDNLGNTVTVADEGGSDASAGLAGAVSYSGSLGNWIVATALGTAAPLIGSPEVARMDLLSGGVTGFEGGWLKIWLTWTDLVNPVGDLPTKTTIGGDADGTLSYSTYLDSTNAAFGTESLVASLGAFGPGAFSDTLYNYASLSAPYSMTQLVEIHHAGGMMISTSNATFAVPEPASLALLGLALLFLGGFVRRFGISV